MKARYINPYTDFGFKKLFGEEGSKELLIDFLNEVLAGKHRIIDLSLKPTELLGVQAADRKAIFDIYCKGDQGESFIVEMQKAKINFFKDRTVFYASFPIREQAEKGEWDYDLKPVYCVAILDFEFENKETSKEHRSSQERHPESIDTGEPQAQFSLQANQRPRNAYMSKVQLRNQYCEVFYDKLTFIFIEMPRFQKKETELTSHFDKWLYFLKNLPNFDDIPQILNEPIFQQGFHKAEIANMSQADLDSYEQSLKVYRDLKAVIDTAFMDGEAKGKLETASVMQKKGYLLSDILEITGLSEADLRKAGLAK